MMQVVLVVLRVGDELLVCWRFLVADPCSDLLGCVQCAAGLDTASWWYTVHAVFIVQVAGLFGEEVTRTYGP